MLYLTEENEMNTYSELKALSETRKRKLANNTYLIVREDGGFGVKLHDTEVVIHYPDRVVLDSGGWQTVTTKSRINEFSQISLYQEKGVWYANETPFADGMVFYNDGTVTGEGEDPRETIKLRARVRKFAKAYAKAFKAGKVPAPSLGDCFGCSMVDKNGKTAMGSSHIHSHLEENYFVPSMLNHCEGQLSQAAKWYIGGKWSNDPRADSFEDIALIQIEKGIKHFCFKELGLVS
jgi:hypothetical protein